MHYRTAIGAPDGARGDFAQLSCYSRDRSRIYYAGRPNAWQSAARRFDEIQIRLRSHGPTLYKVSRPLLAMARHCHSVLLIDDDLAAQESMEELLREEGLDVMLAGDGAEAHEQLRSGARPCVIMLDLRMPGMDGFEFRAEQLRDPALAKIPVIVLSGDVLGDERALELGVDDYLRKPIDADQVMTAIESHCDR